MKKRIQIIITLIVLIIVIILLLVRCSKVNREKKTVAGSSSTEIDSCIGNTSSAENSSTSNSNSTNAYISALNSSTETNNSSHTISSTKTEESSNSNASSATVDKADGSSAANDDQHEESTTVTASEAATEESHTVPDNAGQNSSTVETPANNSSQPVNSTPANDSSQSTNSTPANNSSQPTNSTPANNSSQTTQACNHNWSSRLVTIHHDPEYADEPIYGTKQGVIEEAWDEITGYRYGYITSDGTVFFIDDYGSVSNCVAALTVYCTDNNRSYSTYDQPIYVHHDAVYGDVPDYDNIVGYEKVEIAPAWDEQTFEYYCTKCGEILN